jgi:hypothetical protein
MNERKNDQAEFPFPYFGHGSSYARKRLAACVWFEDPVPHDRRAAVESLVPEPLRGDVRWGHRSLHIESDDAYEGSVREAVSPGSSRVIDLEGVLERNDPAEMAQYFSAYTPSANDFERFESVLETWIRELAEEFPVAFFFKPTLSGEGFGEHDAWHAWSVAGYLERVRPVLEAAEPNDLQEVPWIRTQFLDAYVRSTEGAARARAMPALIAEIEALYESDGIEGPVDPLSLERHRLRSNAWKLAALVDPLTQRERLGVFRALGPYTKLAFYAAHPNHSRHLVRKKRWHEYLAKLVKRVERRRPRAVGPLLLLLADGLAGLDDGGRMSDVPIERARRAATAMDLCLAREGCPLEAYVHGCALYQRLELWQKMLDTAVVGRARARALPPDSRRVGIDQADVVSECAKHAAFAGEKLRPVEAGDG